MHSENRYDVIVAGSGPSGIAAALTSARGGAKTLLIEWQGCVGGISTSGLMSHFTGSVDSRLYDEMLTRAAGKNYFSDDKTPVIDPEMLKITYYEMLSEAGVDIIECNFSCPQMCGDGLGSDVGVNPELVAKYTAAVRRGTKLPVLAKMTPNLANMEPPAIAAINAGADGLAAINTIKSITAVDLDSIVPLPAVAGKSALFMT